MWMKKYKGQKELLSLCGSRESIQQGAKRGMVVLHVEVRSGSGI